MCISAFSPASTSAVCFCSFFFPLLLLFFRICLKLFYPLSYFLHVLYIPITLDKNCSKTVEYAPKGVDYIRVTVNRDLGWMFISMPYVHHVTVIESCSVMFDTLQPHGIVHGILQARILEWVAFPFSRGSSQPRDLPNPGIEPRSPTLQADSLPAEPPENITKGIIKLIIRVLSLFFHCQPYLVFLSLLFFWFQTALFISGTKGRFSQPIPV